MGVERLLNAILCRYLDETLSSRMGKMVREGSAGKVEKGICEALGKLDQDHCTESIEEDEGKDKVI